MNTDVRDGFGNSWAKCALGRDCGLHVVRPGKAQCWCFDCDESKARVAELIGDVDSLTNYVAALEELCSAEQLREAQKKARP